MRIPINEQTNISQLFSARVQQSPQALAYTQYRDGIWVDYTWGEVGREVGRWQAAIKKEGLEAGDRAALCLRNCTEWVFFDQAAMGLGLVVVPLYFGDRPDNMAWCLNDAGARLLLLEDDDVWPELKEQATTLERVVTLAAPSQEDEKLVALTAWLPPESQTPEHSEAGPNEVATLVYTSGTTGRPKGVMLSHRNILSNVDATLDVISIGPNDRFLSFLPLSHMLERTVGYYMAMCGGSQTVFARGITELGEDMQSQRPTVLVCVPRIFERIYARLQEGLPAGSGKRKLFEKAVDVGWKVFKGEAGLGERLLWPILKALVAKKLHARMGGRVRIIGSGGAALAPDLARVFVGLGLPILQGYGLTETSPIVCLNRFGDNDPTSVGRPIAGVETRCDEKGELLVRGPLVMLGYWNNKKATEATIDKDGWFHTGDLAKIIDGRIYLTGRAKEIIVMSNGENVAPGDAEQAIMMDTAFEQVMLIGEGRAKLGLVVVSQVEDEKELCARANKQLRDFPGYIRIHYVTRTDEPWTVDNGLITPTMKVKRNKIEEHYAKEIEAMYAGPSLYQKD